MDEDSESAQAAAFERLADLAEQVAGTAEHSADVHDGIGAHLPGAREHAERDRRLAAAERAAAAAYREHRMPSDEVRAVIREIRPPGAED
jgi:pyruvate/2-oxoglutarate dehydrogenase complex dihydrolipoamide acyltransferase (E2) component